ncbi:hypothetical protein CBP51_08880 [Cellvibrio mixtus]|uniref:DNA gyrase subunit B n=1 Tax=Cellvibrio mixtus TaxID=39650 RepID=A0A266QB50_9GAMM|nr:MULTISPECIES: hypothetical protein [Cellvibrio]AQT60767.1 hypothetical protein B0D95_12270 [Cellvibrio sp. PSBB023]OZY87082.1 hypothetical protein CBP51_08880 [Cellvibrio mixtus]
MKPLITLILVLVSIAYPLLVYLGIQHISPALFALVLAVLAVAKFIATRRQGQAQQHTETALLLVALAYSLALLIANNSLLLKLYPVMMSLCIALLFALSLRAPESLIERLARLGGETITPRAKGYTRVLTGLWALLLLGNAAIALYLALFASLKSWALYCGLLSYVFFGLFFALEYSYRRYYIRKYREPA